MTELRPRDLVNRTVSRTLAVASGVAAAVLSVGVIAWLVVGPYPADASARGDWLRAWPIAVIGLGLLMVTFTPIVQLAAALGAFARMGERREALMTALVLLILVASAAAAFVLGGRLP